jgi:mannose-1-phosphate guanylyltransferase
LSEPSARNTAACIGYAAIEIIKKYGDGIMIITPSDAYIRDTAAFTRVLTKAVEAAEEQDKLVTIGIKPTFPATAYGYIKFDTKQKTESKTVVEFKEKPDEETAKVYLATNAYTWNSGMFIWKASTILKKYEQFVPDIYADLKKIADAMNMDNEYETINAVYPNIRKISVDYAIMEPAAANGDVLVVLGEFGWNDVGSWDMMGAIHDADENGNIALGDTITINTTNSVIYSSKKLIATVGLDNVVIVETPDAIMVCNKDKAQDVKLIVDALYVAGRRELL